MNREIKFRAFNKVTGQMVDLQKITPLALSVEQKGVFLPFHDDWPLMQFTGLQDKNGVEIYEGDIVRQTHFYADLQIGDVRYHAELGDTCGWKCGPMFYLSSMQKEIEVIGNIYENPELISPAPDSNSDRGEGDSVVNEQTASVA